MTDFESIYTANYRRVYATCLRILQNAADAEDVTQEVFIAAFRGIDNFRGEAAVSTWMHRIAVRQCTTHFRRGHGARVSRMSDEITDTAISLKEHFLERIAIKEALAKMPDGYRKVLLMHEVEGFEHTEIAKILGVSVGTSKHQLFKAKRKMRLILKKIVNPRSYVPKLEFAALSGGRGLS